MDLELQYLRLTPCDCYVPICVIDDYESNWVEGKFAEAFIDWSNAIFHNHIYRFEDDVLADFERTALDCAKCIVSMRVYEICLETQEKATQQNIEWELKRKEI